MKSTRFIISSLVAENRLLSWGLLGDWDPERLGEPSLKRSRAHVLTEALSLEPGTLSCSLRGGGRKEPGPSQEERHQKEPEVKGQNLELSHQELWVPDKFSSH